MNEHSYLSNFGDEDVLAFGDTILKSKRVREAIKDIIESKIENIINENLNSRNINIQTLYYNPQIGRNSQLRWLGEGINCEVLKLGSHNWQKGKIKVRVSVEFVPDEPENLESPLDDIRKTINE